MNNSESLRKTSINWYPGHMEKTKREIKTIIKSVDIVVNVVDSRVPYSSLIKDLDKFVFNKKRVILMSKYDLCDKVETEKWINYYKKLGNVVVTCDLKNGNDYKKLIKELENLMEEVNIKRKEKGLLPKKAKILIVGVTNVGKSTLINRIVNKKVSNTANIPGVTRNINTIKINDKLDLVDTPGVLWSKISDMETGLNLASMTIIKEDILDLGLVAVHILEKLNTYYKELLLKLYNLENFSIDNIEECYEIISKHRGISKYKGEIDYDRINALILNDVKSERIKKITFDRISNIC